MLLLIDNYDSFTYNLYQFIGEYEPDIKVVRNDKITLEEIKRLNPDGIIISPGPGRPEAAGICIDVIREFYSSIPILGICLGHQAIGYAFGGNIVQADRIMHGKTSIIKLKIDEIFKNIDKKISVMRYHSLIVERESLPKEFKVICETDDGVIMGIKHNKYKVYGLQFHPESVLTEQGKEIIKNFVGGICYAAKCN